MLSCLWSDDSGSVIAAEYMLVAGVVVLGASSGLVAIREATTATAHYYGETIRALAPDPQSIGNMMRVPRGIPLLQKGSAVCGGTTIPPTTLPGVLLSPPCP